MKKLTILLPCYNEEKGISSVLDKIPYEKLRQNNLKTEVLVIDNNSTDKTAEIARKRGARVITEKKQGKGNAVVTGFKNISKDTDFVVMLDGDNTYDIKEIFRLIEPLENNFCDAVIGSRLAGKMGSSSMTFLNRTGNWLFTFLVRHFYCENVTDVCTGYFAWKTPVIKRLAKYIDSNGFTLEMEMICKMAKLNYQIFSVPITYNNRKNGHSSLSPITDGLKIIFTWFKHLDWRA